MPRSTRRTRRVATGPIDFDAVSGLASAFGTMPDELRRELRPRVLAAARLIANQAKANASFSSRIPGAIRVGATFSSRRGSGARIRVDATRAPHARPLEGIADQRPSFRHPVFARGPRQEWTWTEQPSRPFLAPARASKGPEAREQIRAAVRAATTHLRSST